MTKVTPFRMIGNLYFVGTVEASSHLIDTGDGLILIDTGYEETADVVVDSMQTLGFDIKDVKIILHSHGHYDHTDGTQKILKLAPLAKTYLSFHDIRYIRGFYPDFDIKDGDVIELGNTKIECLFTPGHTEGSVSFFMDVIENGEVYRAAMFGGSGINQLKKDFMHKWRVSYLCRGLFFDSVERLLQREVDVMIGNHSWQNHTLEKYEKMKDATINPFIDPSEWGAYLHKLYAGLQKVIATEVRTKFIEYALCPESTLSAFDKGIEKGANGLAVQVQTGKDGGLVLVDSQGAETISFEEFLSAFADKEISFSVALLSDDIENQVVRLLYKYNADTKTMVTSFDKVRLQKVKSCAPYIRVGYSTNHIDESVLNGLVALGVEEIRANASIITAESVQKWHRIGFNVCAFGIMDERELQRVYDACVDAVAVESVGVLKYYN